jgi:cytochrome c biogenesis protein CcdA
MADFGLAFLAGVLSVLSPCVLPLVPIVLAGALQRHRHGPLALAAGLALAYAGFGVLIASAGHAIGLDKETLRTGAAWMMVAFAAILLSGPLQRRLAAAGGPLMVGANAWLDRAADGGLTGQFFTGMLLGIVWVPCIGPTLGAAVGLAAQGESLVRATFLMGLFGLGATSPLLALAYGSRQALASRKALLGEAGRWGKPVLGGLLLLLGIGTLTGLDKKTESFLLDLAPDWLIDLSTRF